MSPCFVWVALLAGAGVSGEATEWPRFRGPDGSGVNDAAPLPVKWSRTENVCWQADVPGRGVSSPAVAGGRVYLTANSGVRLDRLHVVCFDAATGKRLWHRQMVATGNTGCHPKTNMAAPSPVADADGVYALFATGDLAAFDRDGRLRWYRSLVSDYPTFANQVGMASSPILWKHRLILPMDSVGDSFLAAVDTRYGKNLWKVRRPRELNFITPILRQTGESAELIYPSRTEVTAYDPETGRQIWSYPTESSTIASPVSAGNAVLTPSRGLLNLRPSGAKAEVVWKSARLNSGVITPVVYRGRIYSLNDSAVLLCADANTGKLVWDERLKGPFWASPVAGDGKIYAANENGLTSVVRAGEKGEVLAENDLGEEVLGTPAISDGSLFMRTDKHLFRIGKKN